MLGADKGSKDAIYVHNAKSGMFVAKIPMRQAAIKASEMTSW